MTLYAYIIMIIILSHIAIQCLYCKVLYLIPMYVACEQRHYCNVDIFVQLNFRAPSPRRHFRVDIFSRICQLALFALFALLWFLFSLTSYFRASNTLREMRENMYSAKISTFTVICFVNPL